MRAIASLLLASLLLTAAVGTVIDKAQSPPAWALLERELLRANSAARDRFAKKYLDSRGYLLHTPRWGTLDGPPRLPMPSPPSVMRSLGVVAPAGPSAEAGMIMGAATAAGAH